MNTLLLQQLLKRAGFDPGPLDGIPGRRTTQAVREFQARFRLQVDGVVGPATMAALHAATVPGSATDPNTAASLAKASDNSPYPATPWMETALSLKGLLEAKGKANNPTIMRWAQALPKGVRGYFIANGDATPWCGLFIHNCLAVTLPNEPMPVNPLGALQWGVASPWGQVLSGPTYGAIAMKSRPGAPGSGHVFFVTGADADYVYGVGGNQTDSVSETRFLRREIKGYRWPSTVPLPKRQLLLPRGVVALAGRED